MSKGLNGGLTGKARKNHHKSRAERMYAQQLIAEFFDADEDLEDAQRVIPVRPMSSDSGDSRYAYEFVASAQDEVAQSPEAARFAEAMADGKQEPQPQGKPTMATPAHAPSAIGVAEAAKPASSQTASVSQPPGTDILNAVATKRLAEKQEAQRRWTTSVQPRLYTLPSAGRRNQAAFTWSGLAVGLAIGAAAGGALLGLLSLLL